MPEALARCGRLSHRGERARDRVAAQGRRTARREANGARQQTDAIAGRQQAVAQQRGRRLQRPGHRRRRDRPEAELGMRHRDAQARLHHQQIGAPDLAQEVERFGVRAHERMGSVVDYVAGHRIGEGVGAPAEERAALDDGDTHTGAGETDSRRESGEATADDRDVARNHPASQ
jgi:hypothetical protein